MKRVWQAGGFLLAIALIAYFMWFSWHNLDLRALADVLRKPRTILALLVYWKFQANCSAHAFTRTSGSGN